MKGTPPSWSGSSTPTSTSTITIPSSLDGPSTIQRPFTTFTQFPELPTEIRIQIWGHASHICRALELLYCKVDNQFLTVQHVPAVLHTCKESREVALTYYHLSFGTTKHRASTYFNPSSDIIYFGTRQLEDETHYILRYLFSNPLSPFSPLQPRKVALAEHIWDRDPILSPFAYSNSQSRSSAARRARTCELFKAFPRLEQLICVRITRKTGNVGVMEEDSEDYNGITLMASKLLSVKLMEKKAKRAKAELASKYRNFPVFEVRFMEYGPDRPS